MIFSVYDYKRGLYDYYEVQADTPPTAWFRRPVDAVNGNPNGVFFSTEALAVRLPPGAQPRGNGPDARGVIATTANGVGASSPDGKPDGKNPFALVIGVVIGVVVGPFLRGLWRGR